MNGYIKIVGWKFGKDTVTVKYENRAGMYTLTTPKEPRGTLYSAAGDVADLTRETMGFRFNASFSALSINAGGEGGKAAATVILETVTDLGEAAEIKCPKIGRERKPDFSVVAELTLPGMKTDTVVTEHYVKHGALNAAIDAFLAEAERFVRSCGKRERGLFDEQEDAAEHGEKAAGE